MFGTVAHLWRHPIKGHGVEPVQEAALEPGLGFPFDRVWAIAQDGAPAPDGAWSPPAAFSRGAKSPRLMAIRATLADDGARVTLTHPDQPAITVSLEDPTDRDRLVAWAGALADPGRPAPVRLVRADRRAMTDSAFPSISILNLASLAALSDRLGRPLAMERFRGNVWIEGADPWEEFDLVGSEIGLGGARLIVRERITRCRATMVDPESGRVNADTLGALEAGWNHQDFGVYAEVIAPGRVMLGDPLWLG